MILNESSTIDYPELDESLREIFNLARPFLDTRHNELHTLIAFEFARRLLDAEKGRSDVVLPAILLHDVGWKSIPEDLQLTAFGPENWDRKLNRIHEVEGARIARSILETVDYPARLTEEIATIILEHDSRRQAISVNDAIVKDSDKLWRYSARGVTIDVKRFALVLPRYLDLLRSRIDEFFLTPTAKRLAEEELEQRLRSLGGGEI